MAIAAQKLTFEEYLAYHDGTDSRYELVDGELVSEYWIVEPSRGENHWLHFGASVL